jgi:hypothetical protein
MPLGIRPHIDEAACIEGRVELEAASPFVTVVEAHIPGLPQSGAPRPHIGS